MGGVLCRVIGVSNEINSYRIGNIVRRLALIKDGETYPDGSTKKQDGYECIYGRQILFFAPEHLEEVK